MRGFATGSPVKPKLYRDVETEDAPGLEKYIHQLLDAKRAENGEFFYVTQQELDNTIEKAVAFIKECQRFVPDAMKLRRKKPNDTMLDPPEEMREIYRQLREAGREKFLLEKRIELLESRVQVAIGENRGMKGVASWKWVDLWTMNTVRFKRENPTMYKRLFEKYKRDSGNRKFCLERVDLTKEN
jgi:hypothetical protein